MKKKQVLCLGLLCKITHSVKAKAAMECPVCYENTTNCTLVCGHKFCKSCVKTWYLKGSESGCPMCRRKVHYRRMPIKKWREEVWENTRQDVFQESFDNLLTDMMEPMQFKIGDTSDDSWKERIPTNNYTPVVDGNTLTVHRRNVPVDELVDLEKTYRAIKDIVDDTEELDYILNESFEYYSDRRVHLQNRGGYNEVYSHKPFPPPRTHTRGRAGTSRLNNFQRRY